MTIKTPISLSIASWFLKGIALVVFLLALWQIKVNYNLDFILFLIALAMGTFVTAEKLHHLKEWARLTGVAIALLLGGLYILDYLTGIFDGRPLSLAATTKMIVGVCFVRLYFYLNQPRIKRLFELKPAFRKV